MRVGVLVCFFLIIVSKNDSIAQNKCLLNQYSVTDNHIKAWSHNYSKRDSTYDFNNHYAVSTSFALSSNFGNESIRSSFLLFSQSDFSDSNKVAISVNSLVANPSWDSLDYTICTTPFNSFLDTTYCATATGTPPVWKSGLSTSGSQIKKNQFSFVNANFGDYEYMMSVPVDGFYINDNMELAQTVNYGGGFVTNVQYALRPVTMSYKNKKYPNTAAECTSDLVFYALTSESYTLDLGAVDADGDSIAIEFLQPLGIKLNNNLSYLASDLSFDSIAQMPYIGGLNNSMPLPASIFNYDPNSKTTNFTPTQKGFYNLYYRVYEYRKGVVVAYNDKIVGVYVDNEVKKQPNISSIQNPQSGIVTSNDAYYICAEDTVGFDLGIRHYLTTNGQLNYEIYYSGFDPSNLPSASLAYTNGVDSQLLHFQYVSGPGEYGWKYITLTSTDTTCVVEKGYAAKRTKTISIFIYPPPGTLSIADDYICSGDTVQLGQIGSNYAWIVLSGDFNSLSCMACPFPKAFPSFTTTYMSLPTATGLACASFGDTVTVEVSSEFSLKIKGETVICTNELYTDLQADVTPASAFLNFSWSPASKCVPNDLKSTRAYIQGDTSYFSVQVWDSLGCFSKSDSVMVIKTEFNPAASISVEEICDFDTLSGTASGGDSYLWTFDGGSITCNTCSSTEFLAGSTGTISVTITNDQGCTFQEDWPVTVHKTPTVEAGPDTTIYDGAVFWLDGMGTKDYNSIQWAEGAYLWNENNLQTHGQFVPETSQFILYATNGPCKASDTMTVYVIPCILTPIPNAFSPFEEHVENFKPNMRDPNTYIKMKIFNRWGDLVYKEEGVANHFFGWNGKIDGVNSGELQTPQVFVYVIEVDCVTLDGKPKHTVIEGNVTLVY